MKREVERERRLPAFDISKDELAVLISRMREVFDGSSPVNISIEFSMESEKIQFDSVEELKAYGAIRGRVTNFSIRMSQGKRKVVVKTGGLFSSIPTVKAEAETEIWCAAAIEAVESVLRNNKVWYGWFIFLPLGTIQFFLAVGPWIAYYFFPEVKNAPGSLYLTWGVVMLLLTVLSYPGSKLLPPAAITFTNELGFVRRYGAEIGLVLGVVSTILGIISLL